MNSWLSGGVVREKGITSPVLAIQALGLADALRLLFLIATFSHPEIQ